MVYNFSPGPAMIPEAVKLRIAAELGEFANAKTSVMEISHRSVDFMALANQAKQDIQDLMFIPDDYEVLFLQGGASLQFACVPLNLLQGKSKATYALTGHWSQKAITEAKRYTQVEICTNSSDNHFTNVCDFDTWDIDPNSAYLHITPNETIAGLEFRGTPKTDIPIVADMSSMILSKVIDVTDYDLIYAGAQKNIGIAGLTIVIIKKSLIGLADKTVPALLNYQTYADNKSMFNTPSTFSWYVAAKTLEWLKEQGGITKIEQINQQKSELLYQFIDDSNFYHNPINKTYRSTMNVPFLLGNNDNNTNILFLKQSLKDGLLALKGHKSVGGMRASIYNAMPLEGVEALVDFMTLFEKRTMINLALF